MKFSTLIAALALCMTATTVQADSYFGYTDGTVNKTKGLRPNAGTTQGVAIYIPASKMETLKGKTITGIRTAFGTTQAKDIHAFITTELGGTPLYTQELSSPSASFKDYAFTTPYTITGEGVYIGYTLNVATGYKPLLFDLSKDFHAGTSWALVNDQWTDISKEGNGAPNIKFMVANAPSFCDLIVKPISFDSYITQGVGKDFVGQIYNYGTETISSFDIHCQVGEEDPVTYSFSNVSLPSGATYDFSMKEFVAQTAGDFTFNFSVSNVNGQDADIDLSDNKSSKDAYIYPNGFEKKILFEMFTGQSCGNCPSGHTVIAGAIKGKEDQFVKVAHHSGYYPDLFTMAEDLEYTWFYGSGSYAPACMANRQAEVGSTTPVVESQSRIQVLNAITLAEEQEPFVKIDLNHDFNATTGKCFLKVDIHVLTIPTNITRTTLNVWLTQNGMISSQTGGGSNYVHDHVFRGSLTGIWGEEIKLVKGETITKVYEYDLPEKIVSSYEGKAAWPTDASKMEWVVFVSNLSNSVIDCGVYNCNSIALSQTTSDIESNGFAQEVVSTQIFDLNGKQIAEKDLQPGIYIVRQQMNNGISKTGKVVIR